METVKVMMQAFNYDRIIKSRIAYEIKFGRRCATDHDDLVQSSIANYYYEPDEVQRV